ncbi:MobA/MobL family protein [Cetobacterium sp. ZOR0034]|uniref:MobA/MobL family protein n=5 Tax=unclassified Cetobacterium TaxID=2630983 RepID=UPI00064705DC|nr:MobA/MobL family protein [Cetobacterium sp. ZOR0034]
MAEYRLHYKKGKVGVAKAHAEYILRENKYSKAKEDLIYKESGNMDCIIDGTSAIDFWESADNFERINGVSYRELELNIPNEFNHEQGIELVQNFVKNEIGYKHPYSFAIHESHNKDGEKNLHCHLMFSERELDDILRTKEQFFKRANSKKPELGGAKKDNIWRKKEQLLSLRKSWEVITNTALEKNGFDERVSCESLKKQREEAIKKEQYDKADFLDRNPVNILGKTLRKIKRVGFKNLSKEEQESITKYKEAKEIRASKKREYEIKKGNVVPTKEECQLKLNKITNTTEEDLKLKALNIITKGAFYSHSKILRKIENQLLIDPLNEVLRKQEKELKETINSLKLENENSPKYKRIYEQINRDFEREKEIYQAASKDYRIDKLESLQEEKITKSYENKYKNASSESLEFRMKELEVENPRELAKNVLTNFRLEAITKDIMINEQLKESLTNKMQTQLMIGEREGYKESDLKLKEIEKKLDYKYKEYDLMIDGLEKQKEKVDRLENEIKAKKDNELKVIKTLLGTSENTNTDKVKNYIENLVKLEKAKTNYEYYSNNNIDEKYNIIIYKQRMNILSYENSLVEKEKELIPNKKLLEKEAKRLLESCDLKINSLNKTVDTLEKGKEKLDKFTSEKKLENGYTTIQLLALNKITKGEYNKVFFEAKKISKDINNLEKELSQTSKLNFIKRSSISKDIETLKTNYNKCKSSEENLLKKYKDSDYLKDVSSNINKCLNTAKKRVEKENKSLKEDRNIQYLIKRKLNEIVGLEREFKPYTKNKPIQLQKDLKHTLGGLKKALVQDKKPNQNNLEIKLQKEKEGWEL